MLDFEDFFESSLTLSIGGKPMPKATAKKKPVALKVTKITKPVTKKPILQKPVSKPVVKPVSNILSAKPKPVTKPKTIITTAVKKKLAVAVKAKDKAVVAAKQAKVIAKTQPAKAKILAAKAVTLGKSADKLVKTVNADVKRASATPLTFSSPLSVPDKVSQLKETVKIVANQVSQKPITPAIEQKIAAVAIQASKLENKPKEELAKDIAVAAAPEITTGNSLNETVIQKLDVLEKQILEQQDSAFRRKVLGKLGSIQRRVASGSLANLGVFA